MRNYMFAVFVVLLSSCSNTRHESYFSFDNIGWNTDSIISFKYSIEDTLCTYEMKLKIRHTVSYEYQNLFVFLEEEKKDTIEIFIADKAGKWTGSGIGEIREVEYVFDTKRRYNRKGNYNLNVEQAMRYGPLEKIENLKSILAIGLIISENNE